MKTLALVLLLAVPAAAQDAVPITSVQIVNAPDVRGWPATATITHIALDGANTRIDFTKRDGPNRWPDITPPGFAGPIEYTVWLFLNINGQWVGSGFIQMWNGRDGVGDAPSDFSKNWYYGSRWAPMPTHGQISPTEQIGFMVTSGNARDSGGPYSVQERSNIVLIPGVDTGDFLFQSVPVASPVVVPPPVVVVPPPVVTPPVVVPSPPVLPSTDIGQVYTQLAAVKADVAALKTDVDARLAEIQAFVSDTGTKLSDVLTFITKYILPAATALIAGLHFGGK